MLVGMSNAVVPNLWYAYPWGYPENDIGNGGKHQKKKGIKIKTQKQSSEVLGLQRETYVKVVTRPAHHKSYNYFNAVLVLILC
jgi:hypothetical protein